MKDESNWREKTIIGGLMYVYFRRKEELESMHDHSVDGL